MFCLGKKKVTCKVTCRTTAVFLGELGELWRDTGIERCALQVSSTQSLPGENIQE